MGVHHSRGRHSPPTPGSAQCPRGAKGTRQLGSRYAPDPNQGRTSLAHNGDLDSPLRCPWSGMREKMQGKRGFSRSPVKTVENEYRFERARHRATAATENAANAA